MLVPVTALYAGILALLGFGLAASSGAMRQKTGVSIGAGDHPDQLVAVRRHGNFVEWVPLILILFAVLELNKVPNTAIHVLGSWLVVARILHPLGLQTGEGEGTPLPRVIGAGSTALITVISAIWAITTFF